MTDKRTCRRCGLAILYGTTHRVLADCIYFLRAENERLRAIPEPYQECFRQLQDERERLSERVETLESALRGEQGIEFEDGYSINIAALRERIQAVVKAWRKWHKGAGWKLDDGLYDDLRAAIHELEQEASDD